MRVVIDTNVWLSPLLINDSVSAKAVNKALLECEILDPRKRWKNWATFYRARNSIDTCHLKIENNLFDACFR